MQASLKMFCFKSCHMVAPLAQPTRNRASLSNPLAQPTRNGDSLTNPLAQPTRNTETLTNHHNKASAACRTHSSCSHPPTCPRKQKKQQKKPKTSFVCTHVLVTCCGPIPQISEGVKADKNQTLWSNLCTVVFTQCFVEDALVAVQVYLPPAMHEAFLAITTEFVLLPWRHAMRSALEGASQGGSQVTHPYPPITHLPSPMTLTHSLNPYPPQTYHPYPYSPSTIHSLNHFPYSLPLPIHPPLQLPTPTNFTCTHPIPLVTHCTASRALSMATCSSCLHSA